MRTVAVLVGSALLTACGTTWAPFELDGEAPAPDPDAEPNVASEIEGLDSPRWAFDQAEARFDVPADLLIAMSVSDTRHQMVDGQQEFDGHFRTFGVMALPEYVADHAARLAEVPTNVALSEREANIAAAAALLSAWADEAGIDRDDLDAWAPVVARYSGIEQIDGQASHIHQHVYAHLRRGIELEGLRVEGRKVAPDFPLPHDPDYAAGAEREYARWRPSPNEDARPSGDAGRPSMVIIHSCEGSYAGCWSWLTNPRSRVSAHYVISSDGSETSQLVTEDRKAWHIGASYQCSRNGSTDCWRNGESSNSFTIGIEHAGYASQPSWSGGLLAASARLTCDVTETHGIPRDAYHIVPHGTLQPYNRIDPGPNWPWSAYLADVRDRCGGDPERRGPDEEEPDDGTPAGTRVIDSNNSLNDRANQEIDVSRNWTASANVRGYYESGYWWRTTGPSADSADFRFRNDDERCYTVQAWWPAAIDRSRRAPFVMVDSDNAVMDVVYVDQTASHARWVELGTYAFPAGWNKVSLSRWTDPGRVVVADAVRLVPSADCEALSDEPVDIVIDSDNDNNGADARAEYGPEWTAATTTAGFWGTDYVWAETAATADPFRHWFYLPGATRVRIEARWTAGSNRSTAAPFLVYNAFDTLVDRVARDQTRQHDTWVSLGTWTLPAGWNRVELSRWAPVGRVVVADAVRVSSVE